MNHTTKKLIANGQPHERQHPLADGGVRITTFVPLRFKKRGIQKVIVAPVGVETPTTINPSASAISPLHDLPLVKALGRSHYWQHLLDSGVVGDTADIAQREGIHRATVNEVLRLALLAPDITQAALEGSLPRTMSLESLLCTAFPLEWGAQREMIAGLR